MPVLVLMICLVYTGSAWNALLYGRKRWFLFPPNADYGPQYTSMTKWLQDVYPALQSRRAGLNLECTQHAGEVLFVPEGWHHGVVNLENSVGMAVEVGVSTHDFD
jgi:hypothetical protein